MRSCWRSWCALAESSARGLVATRYATRPCRQFGASCGHVNSRRSQATAGRVSRATAAPGQTAARATGQRRGSRSSPQPTRVRRRPRRSRTHARRRSRAARRSASRRPRRSRTHRDRAPWRTKRGSDSNAPPPDARADMRALLYLKSSRSGTHVSTDTTAASARYSCSISASSANRSASVELTTATR
jgi:hypothetical protein